MSNFDLKVSIEIREGESPIVSANFEGNAEEVMRSVYEFLSKAVPQFSLVNRISFQLPSAYELVDRISDKVRLCQGQILFLDAAKESQSEEKFILALVASHVGSKVGLLTEPFLSVKALASTLGVSEKTIMNIASSLVKKGLVNRLRKGTFEINAKGIAMTIAR